MPARIQEVEDENVALHRRIQELERELLGRSPTKGKPLQEIKLFDSIDPEDKENEVTTLNQMASMHLGSDDVFDSSQAIKQSKLPKTPGKRLRKLTPRSNLGFNDEDLPMLETP